MPGQSVAAIPDPDGNLVNFFTRSPAAIEKFAQVEHVSLG